MAWNSTGSASSDMFASNDFTSYQCGGNSIYVTCFAINLFGDFSAFEENFTVASLNHV